MLKAANPDHFPRDFALLCTVAATAPTIRIDTRTLPAEDHAALIAACDIVSSLHRGEGLGLVPAEALRLGKSLIATSWSGNMVSKAAPAADPTRPTLRQAYRRFGVQRRHQG